MYAIHFTPVMGRETEQLSYMKSAQRKRTNATCVPQPLGSCLRPNQPILPSSNVPVLKLGTTNKVGKSITESNKQLDDLTAIYSHTTIIWLLVSTPKAL